MPGSTPVSPTRSLTDLLGEDYVEAVCAARSWAEARDKRELRALADEKVDFYPRSFAKRVDDCLSLVGTQVSPPLASSARGAGTASVRQASRSAPAPLAGLGVLRVGEDGRLYLASKAEHYHLSVGHAFPGYRLLENARRLGVTNCTHNSTRGHIARRAEEELVAAANGLRHGDRVALEKLLAANGRVLNRVINLDTGSLVVEAALKMVMARFRRPEPSSPEPPYQDRIPVILVMGDDGGGMAANYHGTTILTQVLRGLWPSLRGSLEQSGEMLVRPVRINDDQDFISVLERWERPPHKVAAFFHEIVLMNYGAILLKGDYLRRCYDRCRARDVPVVVDEIQSCAWSPELFMFREEGLEPDAVSVGKGLPGGEYSASRVVVTPALDTLAQFGALVTNGQEELASLAYLVTTEFVRANGAWIREMGAHYEASLESLVRRYPELLARREGRRHLSSLYFHQAERAVAFAAALNKGGIDISVHTYKAKCPPSCLTKLPLTATPAVIELLTERMDAALRGL